METEIADSLWRCFGNPPPFYPQAVTLLPGNAREAIQDLCGALKDSFAELEEPLESFRPLIRGSWWRLQAETWRLGESAEVCFDFARWHERWIEHSGGVEGIFPPSLADQPQIRFCLLHLDGGGIGGGILSLGAGVVGITNAFASEGSVAETLRNLVQVGVRQFGAEDFVIWESEADSEGPIAAGFEQIGPMTVWVPV